MIRGLLILLLCFASFQVSAQSDRGLAKAIAKDLNMDQEQVFQVIKSFKKEVIVALRDDDVVRLQGLGQFYVEHQAALPGNPRTGEMKETPAKNYLRFKVSVVGNQSLNSTE